jgi:aspartate racemase
MKILGMIGGTSWYSTIEYYREINKRASEKLDPGSNPTLIIYSLNIELMREGNIDKISQAYLEIALKLKEAGADAIILCANTPHMVYPFVAPKIDIPILHIADATAKGALSLGLKKLGLLGTKATMEKDFLKIYLRDNHQLDTLTPGVVARNEIHRIISEELTQGNFSKYAKAFIIEEMQKLKLQGADGIILGCTELPMLIKQEDFELPLLNTTELHAQMAVDYILEDIPTAGS